MIRTARLTLIPATIPLARAEIHDRAAFARLLGATVPDNWPPESLADALHLFLEWLEAAPDAHGWFGWYALADIDGAPTLVASGGFMGTPQSGTAQTGYCVLPQFQKRGYATEMLGGLVGWAMSQPDVRRVAADTEWENPASVRVLEKAGFVLVGPTGEPGGRRYEYRGG
jgi:[ribosomal protein S5]-alanine N-acetyltransferase